MNMNVQYKSISWVLAMIFRILNHLLPEGGALVTENIYAYFYRNAIFF